MELTEKQKTEFAHRIVQEYDMDTLIDTSVMGILNSWKQNPKYLKEEIENREDLNKVIQLASDMQPTPPTLTQPKSIPSDVQIGVESTLALSERAPNLFTNQKGEEIPLDDDTDYDEPSDILSITNMISSMYG